MVEQFGSPPFTLRDRLPQTRIERLEQIQGVNIDLITHEALHWIAGSSEGFAGDISFNPGEDSLARTVFYGEMSNETKSKVLAAGSVAIKGYSPFGYQWDMAWVDYYSDKGGGGAAKAQAEVYALFQGFGFDILERGIEIMSYLSKKQKNFSHAEIVTIFYRAKQELAIEGQKKYEDWKLKTPKEKVSEDLTNQNLTIFESGETEERIKDIKGGLLENQISSCRICG